MAGNKWSDSNESYYLHTGAPLIIGAMDPHWVGSPGEFRGGRIAYYFIVDRSGTLYNGNSPFGVRPVVSLSSKAKLSGSGTYNDVYTVS